MSMIYVKNLVVISDSLPLFHRWDFIDENTVLWSFISVLTALENFHGIINQIFFMSLKDIKVWVFLKFLPPFTLILIFRSIIVFLSLRIPGLLLIISFPISSLMI